MMRRWHWIFVKLSLLVFLQFLGQLLLPHVFSPNGYSLKNRFIDSGYGFFSHDVGHDLCSSSASKELVRRPSSVLHEADTLLQNHPQLRDILIGASGRIGMHYMTLHWVARYALLNSEERQALQRHVERVQDEEKNIVFHEVGDGAGPDLSPELITAAHIYAKCAKKDAEVTAAPSDTHEAGTDILSLVGVRTQQFLPGRFLGDPERICRGFRKGAGQGRNICAPPFEVAMQLVPLRLHEWWAKVRWQYHMAEYLRKLLTVWWPLNPYMHVLYRQDMFAMLALMSPYIELEPPIPIDTNCFPPKSYWVIPLSHSKFEQRKHQGLKQTDTPSASPEQSTSKNDAGPSKDQSPSAAEGVFSIPKVHDNYVDINEYCAQAREIHHGFFTGKPRKKPIKIVDSVIVGFDLDMLEIRWHELYHSVDYFVVAEAHHHSLGIFRKPLFFERNKDRYAAFSHKIIHLVTPFEAVLPMAQLCSERLQRDEDACWEYEMFHRDSMLHMLAQINAGVNDHGNPHVPPGFLDDEDLVMISDADEIVMGDRLRHLKFCEPYPQRQFSWSLVHYPGRVDAMALKEFKVMSGISETRYPHSIGPLVDAMPYKSLRFLEKKKDFNYESGHVYIRHFSSELTPQKYLYGGWHLSDTSYLPYLFAKIPSDDIKPGYEPWGLYSPLLAQRGIFSSPVGGLLRAQVAAWKDFRDYRQVGSLCVEAKDVPEQYKEIGFGSMPWIMRCNPMRYPTWFQQPDPRYSMTPRSSFFVYGEAVNAHSLEEWFSIFRFVRDTFSADITRQKSFATDSQSATGSGV